MTNADAPGRDDRSELDPDGDPGNLTEKAPRQPNQAEGEDRPAETGEQ